MPCSALSSTVMRHRAKASIGARLVAGIVLILCAVQLSSIVFTVLHADDAISDAALRRAQSALDMASTLHVQAMTHRASLADDDRVIGTLDATMHAWGRDTRGLQVWTVMSPQTMKWQARHDRQAAERPHDRLDAHALATGTEQRSVGRAAVRIVRPVVLGRGPAADARCMGCHGTGAEAVRPGEVIGAYSVRVATAQDRAAFWQGFAKDSAFVLAMAMAGVAAMALWLRRALLRPLVEVERITQRLANGAIDEPVTGLASSNEFGRIAAALEGFRGALVQRRALAEYNAFLAGHDPLTGLPNRAAFVLALRQMLVEAGHARASGRDLRQTLCVKFDIACFTAINDRLGREAGDAALCALARRLRDAMAPGEAVARLHGDLFAASCLVSTAADVVSFIDRLRRTVEAPLLIGEQDIGLFARIGYALSPDDGSTADALLGNAWLALRRAKADPAASATRYDPDADQTARLRLGLVEDLRHAIDRDEIVVHYQAQHDTMTGAVVGYEALARWHHPVRGAISPALFIPLAEESGLIDAIGAHVLREACLLAAREQTPVRVAVNVSAVQLCNADFDRLVHQTLLQTGLAPSRLELELTETALITHRDRALHALRRLKALGVQIAVDDFGVGYSSLEAISLFPIDKIKVDRAFVSTYDTDPKGRMLLKAIMTIGESLQVPILAEGVETDSQLAFLRSVGCAQVQGYLLDCPRHRHDLPSGALGIRGSGTQGSGTQGSVGPALPAVA